MTFCCVCGCMCVCVRACVYVYVCVFLLTSNNYCTINLLTVFLSHVAGTLYGPSLHVHCPASTAVLNDSMVRVIFVGELVTAL